MCISAVKEDLDNGITQANIKGKSLDKHIYRDVCQEVQEERNSLVY